MPRSKPKNAQEKKTETARTCWATPTKLFEQWDRRFNFTLDVCASPSNAKCDLYFTEEDDGLSQDWGSHTCWMNPPYGDGIEVWLEKAYKSSYFGARVVALVPANTDTRWWHDWVEKGEVELIKGRIAFEPPPGITASNNSRGSALVTYQREYEPVCFEEDELKYERTVWGASMARLAPYLLHRHPDLRASALPGKLPRKKNQKTI